MRDGDAAVVPRLLIFEPFALDTERNELLRDGKALPLRRQSFEVLHYLVRSSGRVVSNDEIVDAVWGVRPAQPQASVTQCIKDIRRALGDDARWMIQTVSGKGYQFKASVRDANPSIGCVDLDGSTANELSNDRSDAADGLDRGKPEFAEASARSLWPALIDFRKMRAAASTAIAALVVVVASLGYLWGKTDGRPLTMMAVPTLAVAPVEATSAALKSQAAAIGEHVTQLLSGSPGGFELSVRAAAYDAGRMKPTRYVLRGVLSDARAKREVIVHLVEAPTNRQVWSGSFEMPNDSDLRSAATQIARTVAVHIRREESRRPVPAHPEAGHYALLGRVLLESERGPDMNRRAMAAFDKAIELDGRHFFGLLGYARTRVAAAGNGWAAPQASVALLEDAQRAVDTAIEVNKRNVGAHILRGVIERIKGNSERSLASLEFGREFNPDYPLVHAEIGRAKIDLGRSQEALLDIERALQLNPTDDVGAIWCYWAGIAAAHLYDNVSAIGWITKALQRNRAYKEPLPWLAIAHAQQGDQGKAQAIIAEYLQSNASFSAAGWLRLHPASNQDVARQRMGFASLLESLGVPSNEPASGGIIK